MDYKERKVSWQEVKNIIKRGNVPKFFSKERKDIFHQKNVFKPFLSKEGKSIYFITSSQSLQDLDYGENEANIVFTIYKMSKKTGKVEEYLNFKEKDEAISQLKYILE